MDEDRAAGAGKRVRGSIKEGVDTVTGDAKLKAEGKADKIAGTAQNAMGGAKDAARSPEKA